MIKQFIPFIALILVGAAVLSTVPKKEKSAEAVQPFVSQCAKSLGADAGVCN